MCLLLYDAEQSELTLARMAPPRHETYRALNWFQLPGCTAHKQLLQWYGILETGSLRLTCEGKIKKADKQTGHYYLIP